MKVRQIKRRFFRHVSLAVSAAVATKKIVERFEVRRKKDDELVATVATEAEANALIEKAKSQKRASLYSVNVSTAG